MRREERHHLKANPLAVLVSQTQERLRVDGRTLGIVAVVVVAGLLAIGGYLLWQQQQSGRAGDLLANAMAIRNAEVVPAPVESGEGDAVDGSWVQPPNSFPSEEARLEASLPELLAAADAYPSSPQGIRHCQVNSPRGTMPGCTLDDPATFGIAFRLTSSATPCGCTTDTV